MNTEKIIFPRPEVGIGGLSHGNELPRLMYSDDDDIDLEFIDTLSKKEYHIRGEWTAERAIQNEREYWGKYYKIYKT